MKFNVAMLLLPLAAIFICGNSLEIKKSIFERRLCGWVAVEDLKENFNSPYHDEGKFLNI